MVMYNSTLFIFTPEQYVKLFTFSRRPRSILEEVTAKKGAEETKEPETRRCSGRGCVKQSERESENLKFPIFSSQTEGTNVEVDAF